MALKDLMSWGRHGRDVGAGAMENVRSLMETMERAIEEPWHVTSARLLGGEWLPPVDVSETEKDILVKASLPGLSKDDVHVSVSEDALTIRGVKRTVEKPQDEGDRKPQSAVETVRSFYRSLSLPSSVRPDDVKASYKDGVLSITLPKAKHSQVKRVKIS